MATKPSAYSAKKEPESESKPVLEFRERLAADCPIAERERRIKFLAAAEARGRAEQQFHEENATDQVKADYDHQLRADSDEKLNAAGFERREGLPEGISTWGAIGPVPAEIVKRPFEADPAHSSGKLTKLIMVPNPQYAKILDVEQDCIDTVCRANRALGLLSPSVSSTEVAEAATGPNNIGQVGRNKSIVLRVLYKNRPSLMTIETIENGTRTLGTSRDSLGTRTVGTTVNKLIADQYASRPDGPKGGIGLTPAGETLAANLCR